MQQWFRRYQSFLEYSNLRKITLMVREYSMNSNQFVFDAILITSPEFQDPAMIAMYVNVNQQIEYWSQITCHYIQKLLPKMLLFPAFIVSFYHYFTTDLGSDAFELRIFMW